MSVEANGGEYEEQLEVDFAGRDQVGSGANRFPPFRGNVVHLDAPARGIVVKSRHIPLAEASHQAVGLSKNQFRCQSEGRLTL